MGEGAQQVQRRGRLAYRPAAAAGGIGRARLGRELDAVDDVAAIARQRRRRPASRSAPSAAWRTGRPCGPPSPPACRRRRSAPPPSAGARGRCRGSLSAWNSAKLSAQSPPCSRKALPAATSASCSFRCARLAGKDQRREAPQPLFGRRELGLVGIFRRLGDRLTAPALRHPFGTHRPCSFKKGMTLADHRARGQLPRAYLAWVQVLGFNGTSIAETAIGAFIGR